MERNECCIVCTLTRVWFRSFINGGINRGNLSPIHDIKKREMGEVKQGGMFRREINNTLLNLTIWV
jgi:hypothetical protein